ncbi:MULTISPECIES: 3-hydroxybenzoate 6-monooxygenase [unclassified Massilia]|uniref:3-hydroxybenzoate 6-monooxygenase n=1 Tax=unclassified Massilia TaxID=2609279 RepID=UPI001782D91A|nr:MULTISPECIES: 3-hydroxybenzoate 6-monooxygenase [unclassified Massilia]MBD8531005.1 3-hydroxybenzoate 6-monooxygenase [Massilia sp. CFBP 13647]MBD8674705.1 3-hydroxybenzoate 6-monooxygenase [Massilia sp. CFBP 13721]
MTPSDTHKPTVIIAGAGIGGIAAALALARLGISVTVLEQSPTLGEIGAGLQLAPNAFAALDALGVGAAVRDRAVFTERLVMMDAVDCSEVGSFEVGEPFRERFGNPYAVIHRADIHTAILAHVQDTPHIELVTSCRIESIEQDVAGVTVHASDGRRFRADYLIGCDGIKSVARDVVVGDAVRVSGHVVYRAVVPAAEMPEALRLNAPVLWAGPNCHLVHYPLRSGDQYNLVVTFHSREQEVWDVRDGSKEEVLSYFTGIAELPRQLLHCPSSWRRWSTADRNPVGNWTKDRITLLGDAAHPTLQYLAQGACMALEDAVTLGEAVRHCGFNMEAAFALYQKSRIARTARVVLSAREMGRLYHAHGVERLVRNDLWRGREQRGFYDALQWLYGWNAADCLATN